MSGPPPYDPSQYPPQDAPVPQDAPYPPPGQPYPPQQPQPPQGAYGQPGYPPPGYPGQGYGYGPYPNVNYGYGYGWAREHPQGTTILILGICSLVVCQLIGPFAWTMGNKALAEIDQNPYAYTNRANVAAGRVCGIIGTALMGLWLVWLVVILIPLLVASGN